MLEFFNQNREKFNLSNEETLKIKNMLVNKNVFGGEKFTIKNEKLKDFMIRRFKKSNNLVESEFNISINKFLVNSKNEKII